VKKDIPIGKTIPGEGIAGISKIEFTAFIFSMMKLAYLKIIKIIRFKPTPIPKIVFFLLIALSIHMPKV